MLDDLAESLANRANVPRAVLAAIVCVVLAVIVAWLQARRPRGGA